DRVTIVSRNMGTVTVEQSADLAVRSTHPVADDFGEHSRWTMDRIVDELVASAGRQAAHCLVILDGDSGEVHVGCRSGDAEGPLSQVSVSPFFPLRQNVPPPIDGGQQCDESRIDDPPYDLPPYDL